MLPELGVNRSNGVLSIGMIHADDWVFHFFDTFTLIVGALRFPCVELEKHLWFSVGNTEHDAQVYLKNQWTDLDGPAQEALFNPASLAVGLFSSMI